jgi:hypothetical protein
MSILLELSFVPCTASSVERSRSKFLSFFVKVTPILVVQSKAVQHFGPLLDDISFDFSKEINTDDFLFIIRNRALHLSLQQRFKTFRHLRFLNEQK